MKDTNKRQLLLQTFYDKLEFTFALAEETPHKFSRDQIIEMYKELRTIQLERGMAFRDALKDQDSNRDPERIIS